MIQEIIVWLVVLVCIIWILHRMIQYFKRISRNDSPCDGCCGCDAYKKKQENCGNFRPKVW